MKILNIALALSVLLSCKQETSLPEGKYRINGTVEGLDQGELYLSKYPNYDTIKVENGTFTIEKEIKEPVMQIGIVKDPSQRGMTRENYLGLFVEPTVMDLKLDYNNLQDSKLQGSNAQNDDYKLDSIHRIIEQPYKDIQEGFLANRKQFDILGTSPSNKEKLDSLKYVDNDFREKLSPMYAEMDKATKQFMKENPKSYVSMNRLLYMLSDMDYDEAKAFYDSFKPEYKTTEFGERLLKEIENLKKGRPGALAAEFSTVDIKGDSLSLSDFKGKYLLIDFWASWCVPCRKGNPHLLSLYGKYKPKGFEILGVSDDDRAEDKWKEAVEKDGIGVWHHVLRGLKVDRSKGKYEILDPGISEDYDIHSLPTKILVDPDGMIVGRYGGGGGTDEDMDRDLAKIFEKCN